MGKTVLGPNTTITVNGTDLSTFCTNVSIDDAAEEKDTTGFSSSYRTFLPGLKDSSITATFMQDTSGTSSVDAIIGGMYYNNTAGTVKVKPDTAGTVVYTQISRVYTFPPVSGAVGDVNSIDVAFRNDSGGLTRGTS